MTTMSALSKLTNVEAKIFAREPLAMFWGLVFPAALLLVLGLFFPGANTPSPDLGGFRLVDLYAPIVLALALATLAFTTLPAILATYRERGVLRRLQTTPVNPWRLVSAQLIVQVSVALIAGALAVAIGAIVFDIPLPESPIAFLGVYLLAAASMLAIGLLIGAVAPTVSSGQGIGMAVYFPMLFFAGVYFPRQVMPEGLQTVSDLTPAGAAVQALSDTWSGLAPSTSNLIVMAAYAIGAGVLAALVFRWE
jgi:ABC-2 type transport system permease protein